MRLPSDFKKLRHLAYNKIFDGIIERRKALREHRDATGDDRCWLDDYTLYTLVEGLPNSAFVNSESLDSRMRECEMFWTQRRAEESDPVPEGAILEREKWDADLEGMTRLQLLRELVKLQEGISRHFFARYKGKGFVGLDDDRNLYKLLPEKLPADFRLPPREDFLGEAQAPNAGCPSFWRSHQACPGRCNFHTWGPCPKDKESKKKRVAGK
jgi:hypothetical protein